MDPQSFVFTPQNDAWRLSSTLRTFQETQQEHADRLMRLERRQDEDARVKSVWGPSSPFPNVLGGTPQQGTPNDYPCIKLNTTNKFDSKGPIQQQSMDFAGFDDEQPASMIRSLHLDADDEPRRFGAASRANSVRFDESANQTLWSHASRSSVDLPLSRTASGFSGLGGHPLYDRSGSHRSDGRHSSAGHSMSGRANSFGPDTLQSTPSEPPGLTPGLFILGSVPSIVRCWLDTNFKHEALLYAAVCSGSYKSYLDIRLISKLGLVERISQDINGDTRIKVSMYLPEAVVQSASSRPSSPASHLPVLSVDFTVIDNRQEGVDSKAIQIFLGSDTLRAHNADILFSSNTMTLYDDERQKLSLPLVRPENDETFKSLYITSMLPPPRIPRTKSEIYMQPQATTVLEPLTNGDDNTAAQMTTKPPPGLDMPQQSQMPENLALGISIEAAPNAAAVSFGREEKPSLIAIDISTKSSTESPDHSPTITSSSRNASSSPAIWSGNWRRESSSTQAGNNADWTASSRQNSAIYMRPNRDQGIKVLKPSSRQPTRSTSTAGLTPLSPVASGQAQSRYFDDGRRKNGVTSDELQSGRSLSGVKDGAANATGLSQGSKLRNVNPVGGASAFGWLNSGQTK